MAPFVFSGLLNFMKFDMVWFSDARLVPLLYSMVPIMVILETLNLTARSVWRVCSVVCFPLLLTFCMLRYSEYSKNPLLGAARMEAEFFSAHVILKLGFWIAGSMLYSRAAYLPFVSLMGPLMGRLVGVSLRLLLRLPSTSWLVSISTLLGHFVSLGVTAQWYSSLVDHLVPVFGRIAPSISPDVFVASATSFFITWTVSLALYLPFSRVVYGKPSSLRVIRCLLYFVCFPLCLSFVLSHAPFTSTARQIVDVVHFTSRHYAPDGHLDHFETGITLQTPGSKNLAPETLARFEETLERHWRADDALRKFDSPNYDVRSTRQSGKTSFRRYDVNDVPTKTLYW